MRISSTPTAITVYSAGVPSWAPQPGQYAQISLGTPVLQPAGTTDPCPDRCVYSGNQGFSSIWRVWNGGAYAPTLGAMGSLLMFGGGHFAYDGNCVIAYDIATRTFVRLNDPSLFNESNVGSYGQYPDGRPYPNHTNMGCEYLPPDAGGGRLGSYAFSSHYQTGVNITRSALWVFDLDTRAWVPNPWIPGNNISRVGITYDSRRRGLWVAEQEAERRLWFMNTRDRVASIVGAGGVGGRLPNTTYGMLVYVPNIDALVGFTDGGSNPPILDVYGLSGFLPGSTPPSSVPRFRPGTTGAFPQGMQSFWDNNCAEKPAYCDEDGNLYIVEHPHSGAPTSVRLFRLAIPAAWRTTAWAWTNATMTARSGTTTLGIGFDSGEADAYFYGKFRWAPPLRSFVWSDRSDLPAMACRPSNFT